MKLKLEGFWQIFGFIFTLNITHDMAEWLILSLKGLVQ
jgi:hypothetical protein